jgi:hypothetical protein
MLASVFGPFAPPSITAAGQDAEGIRVGELLRWFRRWSVAGLYGQLTPRADAIAYLVAVPALWLTGFGWFTFAVANHPRTGGTDSQLATVCAVVALSAGVTVIALAFRRVLRAPERPAMRTIFDIGGFENAMLYCLPPMALGFMLAEAVRSLRQDDDRE